MRTNQKTIQKYTEATALVVLVALMGTPFSVHAYFGDEETSADNTFDASSLDLSLSVVSSDEDSRSLSISNTGDTSFEYSVRVEEVSDPASSFCRDVVVAYNGNPAVPYAGALPADTALNPGDAPEMHEFSFIFDADAHTGETCVLKYSFEARQDGYVHGEAFFDTEVETITLQGAVLAAPFSTFLMQGVIQEHSLAPQNNSTDDILTDEPTDGAPLDEDAGDGETQNETRTEETPAPQEPPKPEGEKEEKKEEAKKKAPEEDPQPADELVTKEPAAPEPKEPAPDPAPNMTTP